MAGLQITEVSKDVWKKIIKKTKETHWENENENEN